METFELKTVKRILNDQFLVEGSMVEILQDMQNVLEMGIEAIPEWLIQDKYNTHKVKVLMITVEERLGKIEEGDLRNALEGTLRGFVECIKRSLLTSVITYGDEKDKLAKILRITKILTSDAGKVLTSAMN